MKVNKYISIDDSIFNELSRENNASSLINELLIAHYNIKNCENIAILEQKLTKNKQILKETRKKVKELDKKILKINTKNKTFLKNIEIKIPKELVSKLKKIDNLNYEEAVSLAQDFDLINRRGIGGIKLIKIWEDLKNV